MGEGGGRETIHSGPSFTKLHYIVIVVSLISEDWYHKQLNDTIIVLLTLTAKYRQRITAITWQFCPSFCPLWNISGNDLTSRHKMQYLWLLSVKVSVMALASHRQ